MIVYSWKQFWNNFNNGDEWLFQDADRPRDSNMFKLRPWMQSDKWKWRDANKDTSFSHIMIKWYSQVTWTWANKTLRWAVPKLKARWTESEIAAAPAIYQGFPTEYWQMEKENAPFVIVRNADITYQTWDGGTGLTTATTNTDYFEIAQSGLYYIMAYWEFDFDTSAYSSTTWYQHKERVGIWQPLTTDWIYGNTDRTQARAVGNGDLLRFMQIGWYPRWAKIVPMVAHSVTSGTNYVFGALAVVRLW